MSFRDLHHQGVPFVLPNAWDVPSALVLLDARMPDAFDAGHLAGAAAGLRLGIAGHLAKRVLGLSSKILGGACNAIFIHGVTSTDASTGV